MECLHGEPASSSKTTNGIFFYCGQQPSCNFFCPQVDCSYFHNAIALWRNSNNPQPKCHGRGVNPGGMGGDTSPPDFLIGGDEYLIVPPIFFICSMKFNSTLFSVYCGHCLSLSILLNIIQIQTRSHMLTQSCFFSNFLRCY